MIYCPCAMPKGIAHSPEGHVSVLLIGHVLCSYKFKVMKG